MINQYYIGAEHIGRAIAQGDNASITRATEKEAIEDAKTTLRNNLNRECVVVVKIVAIVRREMPITVELLDSNVE